MKTFRIIVKEFTKKADGKKFVKATSKGKFVPLAMAEENTIYTVRFCGSVNLPTKEGVYEVACNDDGVWVDSRPDYAEKNILRVRATRVIFSKPLLPPLDKACLPEDDK